MRAEHAQKPHRMTLDPTTVDPDPWRQLEAWMADAEAAGLTLPTAFALATADADGTPSVRMVLIRGIGPDGIRFYTDRRSRKGRDLADNPRAAGCLYWAPLDRQVRFFGRVVQLPDAESAAYFAGRPRASRLSAWASHQGQPVDSRLALESRVEALTGQLDDEPPLPPHWGGFRLIPDGFEFWASRADRLHDRVEYVPAARGGRWARRRLQP